ncbi:phosphoribosyl-ATP pyrophosphohydrolase [Thiospirochaeta perfilievii]|uniref:Phosphoribosyl-ATP pyrophosphohydrolase n=1 Tax=Thiospirochaeta perfilievii TaxID=252967 RepID=A0A5C1Q7U0_9SPIO|nr:nucleoside triphosphate pyrophosphohydrolase [Thiospirochaeta perfilievii]QEN03378.1 phosphoribosyl-ATP pyrophosphohydrolase [Thiospirochaeta perfilievii]
MDNKSITYNKLVRDRIPEIIIEAGKNPIARILTDNEYNKELTNKLQEELNEYKEVNDIEELADLQEVINSILDYRNISKEKFYKIVNTKREQRGSFKDKIFLERVEG